MIEDTSSRPLKEWFEADPDEGLYPAVTSILQGMYLARGRSAPAVSWTFTPAPEPPKPGDFFKNANGDIVGIVQSVDLATGQVSVVMQANAQQMMDGLKKVGQAVGTHVHQVMEGIQASAKVFTEAARKGGMKSDWALFPGTPEPPKEETVRERALRLKQQPHSMTGKDSKFDSHGRCRY